jgi:hypothetical protein
LEKKHVVENEIEERV